MATANAGFSLVDLVYGPMCRDQSPIDRAILIEEEIAKVSEMEGKIADLEQELEEVTEERDEAKKDLKEAIAKAGDVESKAALVALVEAIDGLSVARYGKVGKAKGAKVGDLVIVAANETFADALGEALAKAREVIK